MRYFMLPVLLTALASSNCRQEGNPEITIGNGERIFQTYGCFNCHGPAGQGGVVNENAVRGTVPRLRDIALRMGLHSEEEADRLLQAVRSGNLDPSMPGIGFFLHYQSVIREGRQSERLDPNGPLPPRNMPSWEGALSPAQRDSVLIYLISLQEWEE